MMDASTLELPKLAHARMVGDMREIAHYDIPNDLWIVQWDTIIHGSPETITRHIPEESRGNILDFITRNRLIAYDAFKEFERNTAQA